MTTAAGACLTLHALSCTQVCDGIGPLLTSSALDGLYSRSWPRFVRILHGSVFLTRMQGIPLSDRHAVIPARGCTRLFCWRAGWCSPTAGDPSCASVEPGSCPWLRSKLQRPVPPHMACQLGMLAASQTQLWCCVHPSVCWLEDCPRNKRVDAGRDAASSQLPRLCIPVLGNPACNHSATRACKGRQ